MVTMLSSCMDSITTEPPETTFHVMVCCLPLGSLASHCPASAFRLSNDALAFGADKTGTEMAKNAIATTTALSFICFLPRSGARRARISWEWTSLPYLFTAFWGSFMGMGMIIRFREKGTCTRADRLRRIKIAARSGPQKVRQGENINRRNKLLERQHYLLLARHVNQFIAALALFRHGEIEIARHRFPGTGFRKAFLPQLRFDRAVIAFRSSAFRELRTAAAKWNAGTYVGALHHAAGRSALRSVLLRGSFISNVRAAGHAGPVFPIGRHGLDFKASGQRVRRRRFSTQLHAGLAQHEIVERDFDEIVFRRIERDFHHQTALVHVRGKDLFKVFVRQQRRANLQVAMRVVGGVICGCGAWNCSA